MEAPQSSITIDVVLPRTVMATTKEALRALLHAILFHRLFGIIKPKSIEVLDVTMPGVEDVETEKLINEKVDLFWKAIEGGSSRHGQMTVTFSEKRSKKTWFSVFDEEIPWEQWIINAEVRQHGSEEERQIFDANLSASLTKALITILKYSSSEKGRSIVPLITNSNGISPFPMKLGVKVGGIDIGS